jgi:hypothetical protein
MASSKSSILDPVKHNVLDPGKAKRNTKGTPNGTFAEFNHLPPGMRIEDQVLAVDVHADAAMSPKGPLLSSGEKY